MRVLRLRTWARAERRSEDARPGSPTQPAGSEHDVGVAVRVGASPSWVAGTALVEVWASGQT
jgi:hypothetical protein